MIRLSYSSLTNIFNGHEWLNKMMGIKVPDYPFLKEGTEAHRLIQDHVSGKIKNEYLSYIDISFPVVEEVDYDERCKFTRQFNGYEIYGFIDGLDVANKRFLEIKSSSEPWSISKFKNAMQRKLYAWALSEYEESYLITGQKDPEKWTKEPPKLYSMKITKQDIEDAENWIKAGIAILEKGDFTGGLDENGKCLGCFWNMARYKNLANCNFM